MDHQDQFKDEDNHLNNGYTEEDIEPSFKRQKIEDILESSV